MAVIIQNISTHDDLEGDNQYVVRINGREVARFTHERRLGLAACLRDAATAVLRAEVNDLRRTPPQDNREG